ncbi:MAG: glucosamine-6-phosphate deaminase [Lawsonibacter sp.]|nr:glucosamine-6-phosphate deaminase [Lawsonibacter sp.]
MRIYVTQDYNAMSRKAADILTAQVVLKPDAVLGLATGSTPVGTYKELVARYQDGDLDFAQIQSVNLDEYVGLAPYHDQSYRYFMQTNFFDFINIHAENTHVPNGQATDLRAECQRYNEVIRQAGPVDLQLLGMGRNGHIGFNEPGDCFQLETHVVDLAPSTIEANARFFASPDEVPRQALTMGIKTIMSARRILLAVSGEDKAQAVHDAFTGPVTPQVPASILQLHPDVILVGDEAAMHLLVQET